MDDTVLSGEITTTYKKYSCAGVEAGLADQVAGRAKAKKLDSGTYLNRILRTAFDHEDRGVPEVTALVPKSNQEPKSRAPVRQIDPETLKGYAEVDAAINNLRRQGAAADEIAALREAYFTGLQRLCGRSTTYVSTRRQKHARHGNPAPDHLPVHPDDGPGDH
jgi:hypothetical protein